MKIVQNSEAKHKISTQIQDAPRGKCCAHDKLLLQLDFGFDGFMI